MNTDTLEKAFNRMGAEIGISMIEPRRTRARTLSRFAREARPQPAHRINVVNDKFALALGPSVEVNVLDVRPKDRHALIQVADPVQPAKYLVGHDERHWFVAGVPSSARNVEHAKELLQPDPVRSAVARVGLSKADRFTRRNDAYKRQGEWFFVPAYNFSPDPREILHREPIRRGRSKPHVCEEVVRRGGESVTVCRHFPNGATADEWTKHVADQIDQRSTLRCNAVNTMTRNATVYARGAVRHPDHKTLELKGWHLVFMSNEVFSVAQAFLD